VALRFGPGPMTDAVKTNLGRYPAQESAMPATARRPIWKRCRAATSTAMWRPASKPTRVEAMRAKIKAGGHTSSYRLRKQLAGNQFSFSSSAWIPPLCSWAHEAPCGFSGAGKIKRKIKTSRARRNGLAGA
jgi:hypothetical protein